MLYNVRKRKWYTLITKRLLLQAYLIDVFGNYIFSDFWNCTLSTGGYKFGRFGETLSSCFGKKLEERSLSILGYIIAYLLNILDFSTWKEGGHCKDSILNDEEIADFFERIKYRTK